MINKVIITGRLTKDPTITETKNGTIVTKIILAIPRDFKNAEGIYETDFIPVTLWGNLAINLSKYCKKGDIIGATCKLQLTNNKLELIGERITFLSNKNI